MKSKLHIFDSYDEYNSCQCGFREYTFTFPAYYILYKKDDKPLKNKYFFKETYNTYDVVFDEWKIVKSKEKNEDYNYI